MFEDDNGGPGQEPYVSSEKDYEVQIADMTTLDAEEDDSVKDELQCSTHQTSASDCSYRLPSSSNVGSIRSHSTLGDPNFVENYFKSSRLHFIGTWRNRYRKRFPSSSKGFKSTEPNLNASTSFQKAAIIHIDMDCFFVSVVIRKHPEFKDRPVAVCHSDNPKGTAEISSANYPAQNYGVKAGMFVRDAKAICPNLVIVPYDFEAYEEIADQFYDILHKHCNKVQAVSCDEAFLDVTDMKGVNPEVLASTVRKEIFETTGCSASAGIALNMHMARLATKTAKPDDDYLHQLPIKELPGIGHTLEQKLEKQNVQTCGQLRMISKDSLQKNFGMKTGEILWNHGRGIDNRLVGVIQDCKSIGAEVNWGVRFKDWKDSQHFLSSLCKEVSLRLQGCGVLGHTFTLKIKKRRKDAGEPVQYMGCGECENLSHSVTVPVATDDVEVLQRIAKQLFGSFSLDVKEIRGIRLQVSKLESTDSIFHQNYVKETFSAHRKNDVSSSAFLGPPAEKPPELFGPSNKDHSGLSDPALNNKLWIGSPPGWVDEFKSNKCMVLNVFAELYYKSGSSQNLSTILRNSILESQHPLDSSSGSWIEDVYSFSEILREYIKLKIDSDIEEIYVCFRLPGRFTMNSKFFLQVYNDVFPYLQASVTESYGGNLHI